MNTLSRPRSPRTAKSRIGPARMLVADAPADWEGIWCLTNAAGIGALHLALEVPLGVAVSLSYAAMDLRDALEELERARPDLRGAATAVSYSEVDCPRSVETRSVLAALAGAALERAAAVAATERQLSAQAALSRAMARLLSAKTELAGRSG